MRMCSFWLFEKCPDYAKDMHTVTGKEVWAVLGYNAHDDVTKKVLEKFSDMKIDEYYKEGMKTYILSNHD